jgi:uncharacterized protein (TIGR02611 family)
MCLYEESKRVSGRAEVGVIETLRQAKRVVRVVVGFTLLIVGVLLLVLPGPGWVTIFLGLALLAAEFAWAKRLLDRLKATAHHVRRTAHNAVQRRAPEQPHQ